jgi:folate-binding protein YgfZ
MLQTALHAHLAARGAAHAEDRGVLLPLRFGSDAAAEYAALREGAALVDLGFRTVVTARGADRVVFLQGMLTNDVAGLAPGGGCPALLLTIQGRVTADVRVAAVEDALLLDVDVRARGALVEALEKLIIADDVELAEPAEPLALIGLDGPLAERLLAGTPAAALQPYAHVVAEVAGVRLRAQRASEVRGPGFVLHVPAARAAVLWDALVAAGARPCGMEALEGRRVERGVPRIGVDMDGATLALEVPVEDAISATKGCYLGQEVVARGTARGHVNRRLVGLRIEGPAPPAGAPLVRDGREVGRITSVARAFGAGGVAALGFVRREHWEPGTELLVRHGHAATLAHVQSLPLG